MLKRDEFEAVLPEGLIQLLRVLLTALGSMKTVLEAVDCQVLQEVPHVALFRIVFPSPALHGRMS